MTKKKQHKYSLVLRWDPADGAYTHEPTPLREKPGKYFLLAFRNNRKLEEVQLNNDLEGLVRGLCEVLEMDVGKSFYVVKEVRRKAKVQTQRYSSFLWNRMSEGVPDWTADVVKKVTNNTSKVFETRDWEDFKSRFQELEYQLAW